MANVKERLVKTIKRVVMWGSLIALCSFGGCVASLLSGSVIAEKDYTQEETIGVVSYFGYPVWYAKGASGMGYAGSFIPERWRLNCLIWTVCLMGITVLIATGVWLIKRKQKKGRGK